MKYNFYKKKFKKIKKSLHIKIEDNKIYVADNLGYLYSIDYKIKKLIWAKDFKIPYGVCNLDNNGQLSKISEKPKQNVLANTGLYVLEPDALDLIPKKKFYHMTQLIHDARKKNKRIGIYPISETSWLDVGEWSEYRKTLKKIP